MDADNIAAWEAPEVGVGVPSTGGVSLGGDLSP